MPGVLIVEFMAQVAAVLIFASTGNPNQFDQDLASKVVYFMSMDKVKFRRPVVPGDRLRGVVTVNRHKGNIASFDGKAYVEDTLVAEAEMKAILLDRELAAERTAEGK
jgi:3-hydroxyacyl-[acyl-carrier-protein] dehydratase